MDPNFDLASLTALSPLDGRYARQTAVLSPFFSEYALFRYRVRVEIAYLLALMASIGHPAAQDAALAANLWAIHEHFTPADAAAIKAIEATTRHDVKAVEYWLKDRIASSCPALADDRELIHLGLTSEDVNNLAYALMQADALEQVILPAFAAVLAPLCTAIERYRAWPMLARTHGQPATPTTLGKEFGVFAVRLASELAPLRGRQLPGKLNGATGTFAAQVLAFPDVDWLAFSRQFVAGFGLTPTLVTTQIEPRDGYAALYDQLRRLGNVMIDLSQDLWRYVSDGYLRQRASDGEVGSSAMPHKINPIDFENAEGNLGIANALWSHLGDKLTKSRLQRDLSDSTVLRNVGVAMGHLLLACQSLARGLDRIEADPERMASELAAHPEVVAEAIQTVMRAGRLPLPYERLKALTRGQHVTIERLREEAIALAPGHENLWNELSPATYVGLAPQLADEALALARAVLVGLSHPSV